MTGVGPGPHTGRPLAEVAGTAAAAPVAVARHPPRTGPWGLAACVASVSLTGAVAVSGPSVMEPGLPGRPGQPPWALGMHLSPYLAVALAAAALVSGTVGLALCLHAAHRGWTASPRLLLAVGVLAAAALTLAPPFGSADHLSYAAYGRMAVTGHDPYTTTPAMLARLGDPVARAVQDWRTSPSVYGSLATGGQALASLIGGASVRLTVFVLSVLNLIAFAGTGLLLHLLTRGAAERQFRAAMLWTANPLLLQILVAGAHVDTQAIVFVVAAVAVFAAGMRGRRTRPRAEGTAAQAGAGAGGDRGGRATLRAAVFGAAAGALAGLGFAVKVSMVLALGGLAIAALLTRRPAGGRPAAWLGGLAAGFAVTAGAAFLPWGLSSLRPALRAGSYVSIGSPWRVVRSALSLAIGPAAAGDLVKVGAITAALLVALLLLRRLAGPAVGGDGRANRAVGGLGRRWRAAWANPAVGGSRAGGKPALADPAGLAAASAFALVFAWLVAWPYVLPWYDGLAWALLALAPWGAAAPAPGRWLRRPAAAAGWPGLPWAALDWLLLARTAALAFGYLPARGVAMPPGLEWLRLVFRNGVAPIALLAVGVLLVMTLRPTTAEAPGETALTTPGRLA